VGETVVPSENNIMLYRVHLACAVFELTRLVVIGTDCIGSVKSNYHMITTTLNGLHSQCPCNVLANYGMYNLEGGFSPLAFASDDESIPNTGTTCSSF